MKKENEQPKAVDRMARLTPAGLIFTALGGYPECLEDEKKNTVANAELIMSALEEALKGGKLAIAYIDGKVTWVELK